MPKKTSTKSPKKRQIEMVVRFETVFDPQTSTIIIFKGNYIWKYYLPPGYELLIVHVGALDNFIPCGDVDNQRRAKIAYDWLMQKGDKPLTCALDVDKTVILVLGAHGNIVKHYSYSRQLRLYIILVTLSGYVDGRGESLLVSICRRINWLIWKGYSRTSQSKTL